MTAGTFGYTPGVGADVVVDSVTIGAATGGVQYMKLADGTIGGTDTIPGSAERGLLVEPVQLRRSIQITPVVSTSIYTANDSLFDKTTIANAGRTGVGTGQIQSVVLVDKIGQDPDLDLFFFNAQPAGTYAANAALDISDADMGLCVGYVSIVGGDYLTPAFASNGFVQKHLDAPIPYDLGAGTSLYVIGAARDTPTYVGASDLIITVTCQID